MRVVTTTPRNARSSAATRSAAWHPPAWCVPAACARRSRGRCSSCTSAARAGRPTPRHTAARTAFAHQHHARLPRTVSCAARCCCGAPHRTPGAGADVVPRPPHTQIPVSKVLSGIAGFAVVSYIPYFLFNERKIFGGACALLACAQKKARTDAQTLGARARGRMRGASSQKERPRRALRASCVCTRTRRMRRRRTYARAGRTRPRSDACTCWKNAAMQTPQLHGRRLL
jgi:hypothetical protein